MSTPHIIINERRIATDTEPYIIAELSANHNGKLETALRIVEEAKKAGADAVKLQTYRPDTITLDCDSEEFRIKGGLWDGRTLYELYEEAHMPCRGSPAVSTSDFKRRRTSLLAGEAGSDGSHRHRRCARDHHRRQSHRAVFRARRD